MGLAYVARRCLWTGTLQDNIDPMIKEQTSENSFVLNRGPNKDSIATFIKIANQCMEETQDRRPTMKVVVEQLEKALFFQENNKETPKISLVDIKDATQNFHVKNRIGRGGFGNVYKGNLQDVNGFKTIVAKRLDTESSQGEQQFLSEIQILWEYKHENIIGLVGYCDEQDEKIIVYEYEPKGSLDRYLNDATFTWVRRLNICIDVASALDFIHGGVGKQAKVIHRDIKTSNILLTHDWKAKLADFGLSLISPLTRETDYVIDHACGTHGYLVPLYKKSGFLTIESDIYSFGVVLFEILCGRSTFAIYKHEGRYLPDFIKNKFKKRKIDEVVFEQIRDRMMPKSLAAFQEIAYRCLHDEREQRPTTKEVLTELKKALEYQRQESDSITIGASVETFSVKDVISVTGDHLNAIEKNTGKSMTTNNEKTSLSCSSLINKRNLIDVYDVDDPPTQSATKSHLMTTVVDEENSEIQKDLMTTLPMILVMATFISFTFENNKESPKISLVDKKDSTQNFHVKNRIGRGGFGNVYKGNIQDVNRFKTIVAKRLDTESSQGEQQFLGELQILWEYKNENIIGLVRYCDEQDEKIIVYEYEPKGSLDRYLNVATFTWVKRLYICIDVARALDFIHGGVGKQANVIHRDIKTSNIMLNHDWKTKLDDFWLSLISPLTRETDYVIDYVCRTHGYLDLLYKKSGFLTIESDIYSFGLVLFELLCGRSTFAIYKHEGRYQPDFIKNKFENGKHVEVVLSK
ncbi:uncharacterized protein LOC143546214 [Bidens hawaiensis]|uniref:uncharacterized protein LOC143546214 n=1 Tax=Bidens hawaiensis TaxID=980011 RepID=UPI0040499CCA